MILLSGAGLSQGLLPKRKEGKITMNKRTLLMVVSLVASLALMTTGTLAYLSDSDMDTNVMTLGNVDIVQNEQERTEDGELDEFTQNKPLYPAVFEGSSIPWADPSDWVVENDQAWKVVEDNENVVDKFVTVTNTGKSDAFIRTIIAYEGDETYGPEGAYIHVVHNGSNVDPAIDIELIGTVNIDGTDYTVYSYTYPEALAAGETSIPSLKQLYMNKAADNDVMEEYGDTYDVLVLSQAVQTQGFDDAATALDSAFGDVTADNVVEWFATTETGSPGDENDTNNPPPMPDVVATTDAELLAAIQDADVSVIGVDGELTYDWGGKSYANSEALLMKNKTFVGVNSSASLTFKGYGSANPIVDVTLRDITIYDETVGDNESSWEHGYLEFEGLTAKGVTFANAIMLGGTNELTDCKLDSNNANEYAVWVEEGNTVIDGCTFTGARGAKTHEAYSSDVKSLVIKNSTFTLTKKPALAIGTVNAGTSITMTGNTIDAQPGDQGLYIYETDTDVSTFTFSESDNTI